MNNFTICTPTNVVFGENTELQTGTLLKEDGATKVMVVHYGNEIPVIAQLIERVKTSIEEAGLSYVNLDGVVPNPKVSKVREAIALAKEVGVDYFLAIGGGSAIDTAKAAALGMCYDGDVWDLFTGTVQPTDCYPVAAVLTIAASGSEMSNGTVITNDDTLLKRDCGHVKASCRFAVMNPAITLSLPAYQTASGCADILMHTMERYISSHDSLDITDGISEGLMKAVIKNTKNLIEDPQNMKARWEVMWAGSLSHNGLTGCGIEEIDFPVHMLEHELGGIYNVTHGAGLTAIWASWAREMLPLLKDRLSKFAINVWGVEALESEEATALAGIKKMEEFYQLIKMPISLAELGLSLNEEEIDVISSQAIYRTIANPQMKEALKKDQAIRILNAAK